MAFEHTIEERELQPGEEGGEEQFNLQPAEEPRVSHEEEQRIEKLFEQAREKRSKAYELKGQLDRLDVFDLYEDRFLDLFKKRA